MMILENLMEFQGLDQYSIQSSPAPGVLIVCTKVFGIRTVEILTGGGGGKKKQRKKDCMCFPHFAFGVIESADPAPPESNDPAYATKMAAYRDALFTARIKYDVHICAGDRYVFVKDVLDANFGVYTPGQYVMVTMGDEMDSWTVPLDCGKTCLMSNPRFDVLIVAPLHVIDRMRTWRYFPEEDAR